MRAWLTQASKKSWHHTQRPTCLLTKLLCLRWDSRELSSVITRKKSCFLFGNPFTPSLYMYSFHKHLLTIPLRQSTELGALERCMEDSVLFGQGNYYKGRAQSTITMQYKNKCRSALHIWAVHECGSDRELRWKFCKLLLGIILW